MAFPDIENAFEYFVNKYDKLEWVPPTDEERQMFMDAANAGMNMAFDMWYINECNTIGNARGIAESVAMDGL